MSYEESDHFDTPSPETVLWRYMSIDKFIAMISTNKIYFPNINIFEDKKEGTLSEKSKEEVYKTNLFTDNTPLIKDKYFFRIKEYIQKSSQTPNLVKHLNKRFSIERLLNSFSNKLMFCNSWFRRKDESHLMWSEYGYRSNPASVVIQTTVGNLIDSVELENHDIHIGKVKYIDYEKDYIKGYRGFASKDLTDPKYVLKLFYAPVMHKSNVYVDEHEVRAIISFNSISKKLLRKVYTSEIPFKNIEDLDQWDNIWPTELEDGTIPSIPSILMIDVDLNKLFQKVVISPNSVTGFFDTFKKLLEKYDMDPEIVENSKL